MSKKTTITTPFRRELTVEKDGPDTYLRVTGDDFGTKHDVKTFIPKEQVTELVNALVGENGTLVTDLPEATVSENGLYVAAGDVQRRIEYYTAEDFLTSAKQYLALHAFMVKHEAEQEAAKAAEAEKEAQRTKRRNELAAEFRGYGGPTAYSASTGVFKAAIDRIIDLEEAAKVS